VVDARRPAAGGVAVLVLLALLATAACGPEPGPPGRPAAWSATSTPTASPSPDAGPTLLGLGAAPSPSSEPTATEPSEPASTAAPPPPPPEPTRRPVAPAGPPPPPPVPQPPPSPEQDCPWYDGSVASRAEVRDALVAAAGHRFWPDDPITAPVELMKAIAWQESGWQSTIIACDGGIGTMQIMPDTATWMNTRFGTSLDVHTLTGNTMIGAAYVQWLIKYFGDVWFGGSYELDPADCADHLSPCLLNAVIASYNYGFGAVDQPDEIVIPNPRYVENVRALMTECVCLSF
jgi:hypothetical protein